MLNKNFIHIFDEKMHYSIYYSLLKVKDGDKINFNDSVQHKKCHHRLGRWNFIVADKDYSCGVYHALEVIRQSILSAKEDNKSCVDIALIPDKDHEDVCYIFNPKGVGDYIEIDGQKKYKALPIDHNENCESNKITKTLFYNVIKPVLEEILKTKNYKITIKKFKDKMIYPILFSSKQNLDIIRIEWGVGKCFNDLISEKPAEMALIA